MTRHTIITGIDIGAHAVRTVISEYIAQDDTLRILGVGSEPSVGLRKGAIVDPETVSVAIDASLHSAETMAGTRVKTAFVSIGGAGVSVQSSKGVVAVGRADGEISDDDVERVIAAAQAVTIPVNKEIIHIIPRAFHLDEQKNLKDPIGMSGVRLEVEALVVEVPSQHLKNLTKALQKTNIDTEDMVLSSLACAEAVLDAKQKEIGVALVTIGESTTSLAVFEDGDLLHTTIIPVGAGHITNDIAIGLRTSIETAEKIKVEYGSALVASVAQNTDIDLSLIDSTEDGVVSHEHVVEIIEARLAEIFEFVEKELKEIERDGLLPAGVVLTGGGAELPHIVDFAKQVFRLPAQIGFPKDITGVTDHVDTPSYATAVGLVLWGLEHSDTVSGGLIGSNTFTHVGDGARQTIHRVRGWFEKFLP